MSAFRTFLRWGHSHYMNIRLHPRGVTVMNCANVMGSILEGHNIIHPHVTLRNCRLGLGSFVGAHSSFVDAEIGRFCSIASNVQMILGRHPTRDFVSTHPAFFSIAGQGGFTFVSKTVFAEDKFVDEERGIRVSIGNDVWIGIGAVILEGCSIGNGAIIGAHCLVTRDVEPYSIVSGVPGSHVRYRFDEDERAFLQEVKWWSKDWAWIAQNSSHFHSIKHFMAVMRKGYH
jgi:acetyltransferase-like isoleucine patch superfamily enzyme